MKHKRASVIKRTRDEFRRLDGIVSKLSAAEWNLRVPRPETKDPWTIKDALAHITHWKADMIRAIHGESRLPGEVGPTETAENHRIYVRWHRRSAREVLAWHRQVQKDVLKAMSEAQEAWFSAKDRKADWPYDVDGHSSYHRIKDIEQALAKGKSKSA